MDNFLIENTSLNIDCGQNIKTLVGVILSVYIYSSRHENRLVNLINVPLNSITQTQDRLKNDVIMRDSRIIYYEHRGLIAGACSK